MKSYTDIEQSKILEKILPSESADRYWDNKDFSLVNTPRIHVEPDCGSSIFDELEANVSLQEARPILEQSESAGWDNKMFVKASLMLHRIRITDIKAERLQDISEEDCLREGVNKDNMPSFNSAGHEIDITYYWVEGINKNFEDPYEAFAALIDHISGKGTWERNPWVFAYEIELVK